MDCKPTLNVLGNTVSNSEYRSPKHFKITNVLSVSMNLLIWGVWQDSAYIKRSLWALFVSFCDWLLSPSMFLRFIPVVVCIGNKFLFMAEQFSCLVVSAALWPPWTAACQASLSITNSWTLLKLMPIESVMPSSHLILCCPLLLLPSIFPRIRVFSSESVLPIRWPEYWSFSFSISPSDDYSGLISFRMDWLDLLAVQGTLKRLLQHHSSKASILRCSAFYIIQLTSIHDY